MVRESRTCMEWDEAKDDLVAVECSD